MKKTLSFLSAILLLATLALPAFAESKYSTEAWEKYWNSYADLETGIIIQPGTNETQRNFSWYVSAGTKKCYLEIGKDAALKDAKKINAELVATPQGDYAAKVTAGGLEYATTYYYRCVSDTKTSSIYSFKTAAATGFSAIYVSDVHIDGSSYDIDEGMRNAKTWANVLAQAKTHSDINLVLSAGDQATNGLRNEYLAFCSSPEIKGLTVATTLGNHDYMGDTADYRYFTNLPNEMLDKEHTNSDFGGEYWFVKDDVLFIVLDSNEYEKEKNVTFVDHEATIKAAVEANPGAEWRVIMSHHDLYSGSMSSRESTASKLRADLGPVFDKYHIDLVLTGHTHIYSVTHSIKGGAQVNVNSNGTVLKDTPGTVYMVASSVTNPRSGREGYSDLVAFHTESSSSVIYTILTSTNDKLSVKSYDYKDDTEFSSFELVKTRHPHKAGDADGNGKVEVADARYALRQAVGLESFAPGSAWFTACDVDNNSAVTVADARSILRTAVGL